MNRSRTIRLTLHTLLGLLSIVLITLLAMGGCALPRHTIGLDAVLTRELGRDDDTLAHYRCTMGAHRGDSVMHVENTLDAVVAARHDRMYAFIECDLQYSADGQVVAFHDKRLRRVFGPWARVGASTYDELRELTHGAIATYDQIMQAAAGKRINIEIKSQGDDAEDRRLVDFVVSDIRARGIQKQVLLSSISEAVITYISETYPRIATGQIFWIKASTYLPFDFLTRGLYHRIEASGADYLMLHAANLRNIADLLRLKPPHKTVIFWDFDDTMYLVHKDLSDRLWGDSFLKTLFDQCRYRIRRRLSSDSGIRNLQHHQQKCDSATKASQMPT